MANTGNTQQQINYGASANDGQGDPLRTAFIKTDDNFDNVWLAGPVGSNITIGNNTIQSNNTNGNIVLKPNGTGIVQANASVVPNTDNVRDLGSSTSAWRRAYINELLPEDLTVSGDATIGGNLTVQGDTIQIGNITTDTLTIQLANTATNAAAATGAGITVGASDNIATILYNSTANRWNTNIGLNVTGGFSANSSGNVWSINNDFLSFPSGASWRSDKFSLDEYISSATDGYLNLQTFDNTSNVATEFHMEHGIVQLNIYNGNNVTWEFDSTGNLTLPGNTFAVNYANGSAVSVGSTYGNANVANYLPTYGGNISAGNVSVSDTVNIQQDLYTKTGTFTGGPQGDDAIYAGYQIFTVLGTDVVAQFSGNTDAYIQFNFQNGNAGNQASGDYVITADNGDDTTHFLNIGLTGGNWDGTQPNSLNSRLGPNDGYMYVQDGNLAIGVKDGNTTDWIWRFDITGSVTADGNLIPSANGNYSLGNSTNYWANVWVGNITTSNISVSGNITGGNISTGVITLTNGATIRDTSGDAVAFGQNAGLTSQGNFAVGIGRNAGQTTQGGAAVAIGVSAGDTSQGNSAVAVGQSAGFTNQSANTVAVGVGAGQTSQGVDAVAVGASAGSLTQGIAAVAIGTLAGRTFQANNSIIINATGANLDQTTANTFTVAPVRNDVANVAEVMFYNTTSKEITYGNVISVTGNITAGNISTGQGLVQSLDITADGIINAGALNVNSSAVPGATGNISAGNIDTGIITLTNGAQIRDTAGNAVAFGLNAGQTSQNDSAVAIGPGAGEISQGFNAVAVGFGAGANTQGSGAVSVGVGAGFITQGDSTVAIGATAGYQAQAVYAVAIGLQAGQTSQAQDAIAIGRDAGKTSQGEIAVAIGHLAGNGSQGNAAVAIGASAGANTQGVQAVAIGTDAGATSQANRAVAIGYLAGSTGQGTAAVAIGYYAGELNQGNNSIIINATDTALQQTTANTFTVAPVRNDVANVGEVVFYNTASKEITYGNTISVAGNITGNYILGNGSQLTSVNAVTVDVTDTNGLTTVYYPTFVENRTTTQIARADVDLTYRTDDNLLTVGNVSVTGNITGNTAGFAIGYRDIPQVSFIGNATIATADAGKHFYSTQSTDYILTIANNASQGFQTGAAITVINQGTGNITLAQGSGVTLYLTGNATSGNRTVTTFGMATLIKVATDTWFVSGAGVI